MWQNVTNMGLSKGNRLFYFFSAVKLQSSHVFTCPFHVIGRYHRECILFSQIYCRVHFMLSDILQSPFYVVRYITESILCCQIYHRVHFMLSDISQSPFYVVNQTHHRQHSIEAPFPWTTQFWSTISTEDTVLKHHFHWRHRVNITQVWLTTSFWHNNSSMTMIFIQSVFFYWTPPKKLEYWNKSDWTPP